MKIHILVPSHDMVHAVFASDLAKLVLHTARAFEKTEIVVTFKSGPYITTTRQELLKEAIKNEADFVLWLDSDMRFPKDTFHRLWDHDVAMVGVNGMRRAFPTWPTAIKYTGLDGGVPERLYPHESLKGLMEVEAMGFGVVLMAMADFKDIPPLTEGPWFTQAYIEHLDKWVGEDTMFCYLVRKELGIKVMIDQDLSWEIGHIGQVEFTPHHLEAGVAAGA